MKSTLSIGSSGPPVRELQAALNLGNSAQPKLSADGAFGPKTRSRVTEFQSQNSLVPDGVVGQMTWNALAELLQLLAGLTGGAGGTSTSKEDEFRNRIVSEANQALSLWGWIGPVQLNAASPRIAAARCANSKDSLRPRQGGTSLAAIFTLARAGAGKIALCPSISSKMEALYQLPPNDPRKDELNVFDIGAWCGIFSFYIYRKAGLNLGPWDDYGKLLLKLEENTTPGLAPKGKQLEVVRHDGVVKKGDLGVLPKKSNHHIIVIEDVSGDSIKSIEGNVANPSAGLVAPWNSVIAARTTHTRTEVKGANGYFLRPIWENLTSA